MNAEHPIRFAAEAKALLGICACYALAAFMLGIVVFAIVGRSICSR
jgi:hypothetical protein